MALTAGFSPPTLLPPPKGDSVLSKDTLLVERERLENSKTALMASQVIADLNAINGGLQTIDFLLGSLEEASEE